MNIPIGFLLVIFIICVVLFIKLIHLLRLYAVPIALLSSVCLTIGLISLCNFIDQLPDYHTFSKSEPHFKTEEISPDLIKQTQFQIIEKRSRNWFTKKWSDESTSTFEEKIIEINFINFKDNPSLYK